MVERLLSMREVVRSMLTDSTFPHSVMVNIWPFQGRARGSIPRVGTLVHVAQLVRASVL